MNIDEPLLRSRWWLLLVGGAALLLCLLGRIAGDREVMVSYLLAFVFWWSASVGSLGLTMVYYLTGGRWGEVLRPFMLSGIVTLPLMFLLALPLAFQLPELYLWSRSEAVAADPALQMKSVYLNRDFFLLRTVIYFVVWLLLGSVLLRWSRPELVRLSPRALRLRRLSAAGLIVLVLTASAAAVDWVMSLEPAWYSTLFPGLITIGALLIAYLLMVGTLARLADREPLSAVANAGILVDLGNLMLTFITLWTYFFFSQFLIIWSGNLPDEARWFLKRTSGGWQIVILAVMILHFLVPLLLLLSRGFKENRGSLATVALGVLGVQYVYLWWTIRPSHFPARLSIHWADIVAPIGIGGLWLFVFSIALQRRLPTAVRHLLATIEAEQEAEKPPHA